MALPNQDSVSSGVAGEDEDEKLPMASVVIAVRNEAGFIENSLRSVFQQDYPAKKLEVIVADGMSTDNTREIVRSLQDEYVNLRLIENPKRIVPSGVNAAIEASNGEIIIWLGGHSTIARDYIIQSVLTLKDHPEAWSVGGPIISTGRTLFGKAVAIAMSHPLGVGNATHRFPDFEGYGEGAPFPVIRRWVFDRIGKYDEQLIRNQDDEFNYRMAQAGGRVYLTPRISSTYFVREALPSLFRQYFQYSFWRIPVMRKHRRPTTMRQVVPPLFYLTLLALALLGLWLRQPLIGLGLEVIYLTALLMVGMSVIRKVGFRVAIRVPVAIATMHLAYAVGLTYGFWASRFRPGIWTTDSHMSKLSR